MPIYEYSCRICHSNFEELVRGVEKVRCPACGAIDVTRRISVCGLVTSTGFVGSAGSSCVGCKSHNCNGCQ